MCNVQYGQICERWLNNRRDETLTRRSKVDLSRLQPVRENLVPNITTSTIEWPSIREQPHHSDAPSQILNKPGRKIKRESWNQCGSVVLWPNPPLEETVEEMDCKKHRCKIRTSTRGCKAKQVITENG